MMGRLSILARLLLSLQGGPANASIPYSRFEASRLRAGSLGQPSLTMAMQGETPYLSKGGIASAISC